MENIIRSLDPGSPLEGRAHAGDRLVSINGHVIRDVLDYKFHAYDRDLKLVLQRPDGSEYRVHVRKAEGGDLGLDFESYLMDRPRACANNCIFCFIDQLPPGMRQTMYFKDDDARLSFLLGNYITLTNLSEREIRRIIDLHISPVNVSVHTMNPALRVSMLRNPRAGESIAVMKRLAEAGIVMNCQIVCCPGWNDGDELLYSMRELKALFGTRRRIGLGMSAVSIISCILSLPRKRITIEVMIPTMMPLGSAKNGMNPRVDIRMARSAVTMESIRIVISLIANISFAFTLISISETDR
jgi:putative radical SAM enzyme (TIGR03279 family)